MTDLSALREGDEIFVVLDYGPVLRRVVARVRKVVIVDDHGDQWRRRDGEEFPFPRSRLHAKAAARLMEKKEDLPR